LRSRPRSASWPRLAAGEGLVAMRRILPNAFTQIREDQ
jgi:succinylarginine dihydrolase